MVFPRHFHGVSTMLSCCFRGYYRASVLLTWCYHGHSRAPSGTIVVLPWRFHGARVVVPWRFRGYVDCAFHGGFHGASIVAWWFHGTSVVCFHRDFRALIGTFVVLPWFSHGASMVLTFFRWASMSPSIVLPWYSQGGFRGASMVLP